MKELVEMIDGISKRETIMVTRITLDGKIFYITSNIYRDVFYIYKEENGKAIKLGKGENPIELEEQYINNNEGE